MPRAKVYFYKADESTAPGLDWLRQLRQKDRRGYAKCVVRIQRLAEEGHALRRPEADYLRDGIYELRTRRRKVAFEENPKRHLYEDTHGKDDS